jgi:hypothetical protein
MTKPLSLAAVGDLDIDKLRELGISEDVSLPQVCVSPGKSDGC